LSSVETTGIDQFIVMFQVLFEKETELILPLNLKESGAIDVRELTLLILKNHYKSRVAENAGSHPTVVEFD